MAYVTIEVDYQLRKTGFCYYPDNVNDYWQLDGITINLDKVSVIDSYLAVVAYH